MNAVEFLSMKEADLVIRVLNAADAVRIAYGAPLSDMVMINLNKLTEENKQLLLVRTLLNEAKSLDNTELLMRRAELSGVISAPR
jgi:hypothetical protein